MFCDTFLEKFDNTIETSIDLLASVILFFGVASNSDTACDVIPSFDRNFDVGVDLKLDSPSLFAFGDKDVGLDRYISFFCLAVPDKKSDCIHKYSSF